MRTTDFERVLGTPSRARSAHFAVHHVAALPQSHARPVVPDLSTDGAPIGRKDVDDLGLWLGAVVPKRHARRAVTRALLKRQIRTAVARHSGRLPGGLWVVRLRAPFDRGRYASAASESLREAARSELDSVLDRAAG